MDLDTIIKNAPLIRQEQVENIIGCNAISVQVAGTNGKGSTCAFLSAILQAHGKRVGVYTSPHVIDITERIEIDGKPVKKAELERLVNNINDRQAGMCKSDLLFFAAVEYFNAKAVDFAIFETGLGGTKDSATLVNHEYGIITKVSLDHTDLLGETVEQITGEKAGIIKRGMKVYSYPNECSEIIEQKCKDVGASLKMLKEEDCPVGEGGFCTNAFELEVKNVKLSMKGDFQRFNCALSLLCAKDMLGNEFNAETAVSAVESVMLTGRMTMLSKKPLVIADVSHNPDGIKALCRYVNTLKGRKCAIVAVPNTKDYKAMMKELKSGFDYIIATKADKKSVEPKLLDCDETVKDPGEALLRAKQNGFGVIVFCGSFAVVRKAFEIFR